MYDPNALARSNEKLERAREDARQLRLSLRATRDESRPIRLLQRMLAGEKFWELDERSHAREVWLELSRDQNRMCVFPWRRTATSEPLYEIDLAALRKIAFGQSSHPAARSLQVRGRDRSARPPSLSPCPRPPRPRAAAAPSPERFSHSLRAPCPHLPHPRLRSTRRRRGGASRSRRGRQTASHPRAETTFTSARATSRP